MSKIIQDLDAIDLEIAAGKNIVDKRVRVNEYLSLAVHTITLIITAVLAHLLLEKLTPSSPAIVQVALAFGVLGAFVFIQFAIYFLFENRSFKLKEEAEALYVMPAKEAKIAIMASYLENKYGVQLSLDNIKSIFNKIDSEITIDRDGENKLVHIERKNDDLVLVQTGVDLMVKA